MLLALIGTALLIGVTHTLLGPDHYAPLIAIAKARAWSLRKALAVTLACGALHCGLAFVALCLASPIWIETLRADLAACGLVALGVALLVSALRAREARAFSWPLYLVFALGPCEWLLPAGAAAWAEHGLVGASLVALAFSLATIGTMVALVAVGVLGLARMRVPAARTMQTLAGVACAACGALMLVGL